MERFNPVEIEVRDSSTHALLSSASIQITAGSYSLSVSWSSPYYVWNHNGFKTYTFVTSASGYTTKTTSQTVNAGTTLITLYLTHTFRVIQVGETIPDATFFALKDGAPSPVTTAEIFGGKKVVLFAVPGAFTPTCSKDHCPGFVRQAQALKAKGVDTIACTAVNDAFVLGAWAEQQHTGDHIIMLADGSAKFAQALGLDLDLTAHGMGVRSKRYVMIVEDRVVKHLGVDEKGHDLSSALSALAAL